MGEPLAIWFFQKDGVRDKVAREESLEDGLLCNAKELLLTHEDDRENVHVLIHSN